MDQGQTRREKQTDKQKQKMDKHTLLRNILLFPLLFLIFLSVSPYAVASFLGERQVFPGFINSGFSTAPIQACVRPPPS